MATLKFVQAPTAAIALPMGDSDTSFYGLDIKDINGNYLSMTDFGTIGYMTINPTSPYAEIVSFTGCVYQGDGTTLFTGVTRGLLAIDPYTTGGTAYAHSPNDSLVFSINPQMLDAFVQKGQDATITGTFTFLYTKMPRASATVTYGVGSDLWFATKEYVDGVAIAGAPNASTSTKGIGRVSVAPVSATIPIFVGDNDPRVPSADVSGLTQNMVNAIEAGNAPAALNPFVTFADTSLLAAANKIPIANATGKIDPAYIQNFAGDGSDGALTSTSGSTNIDLGAASVVIKQYTSVSITGTGQITCSNPHANGTLLIIKSQGGVTMTSSTIPNFDMSGMGAAGGTGGAGNNEASAGNNLPGSAGSTVNNYMNTDTNPAGGGGAVGTGIGPAGAIFTNRFLYTLDSVSMTRRQIVIAPGFGGGGGAGSTNQTTPAAAVAGGTGGRGGGALVIQCGGALNFTSTLGINVSGLVGSNGNNATTSTQHCAASGGGGGGGSGMCLILYNTLTAASGTVNAKGGNGGTGGTAQITGINTGGNATQSGTGGGGAGSYVGAAGAGGAGLVTGTSNAGSASATAGGGGGGGGGGGTQTSSSTATGGAGGSGGATSTTLWLITKNYYQA